MTNHDQDPPNSHLDAALEALTDHLVAAEALELARVPSNQNTVPFRDLYRLATGGPSDAGDILVRISTDSRISSDLARLLDDLGAYTAPNQAAASSDDVNVREDAQAGYRIETRSAADERTHLMVTYPLGTDDADQRLYLYNEDGRLAALCHLPVNGGRSHLILDTEDPVVAALHDPTTVVKLL